MPVLVMTAPLTHQMLFELEDMAGFKIPKPNYVWTKPSNMEHHSVASTCQSIPLPPLLEVEDCDMITVSW